MLITADFHLGLKHRNDPLVDLGFGKISVHTYAVLDRFNDLCSYAEKKGIGTVAILGDVFHTPYPDVVTVSHFQAVLNRWRDLTFLILGGNHDCDANYSAITALRMIGEAHVFVSPDVAVVGDDTFCVVPHMGYGAQVVGTPTHPVFPPRGNAVFSDMCLLSHAQIEGVETGFEMESTGSAMTISTNEAKEFRNVYLGHIHKPTRIGNVRYPGSPFPCSFGEIMERKSFFDLQAGKDVPFDRVEKATGGAALLLESGPKTVSLGEAEVVAGDVRSVDWGHTPPVVGGISLLKVKEEMPYGMASDIDRENTKKMLQDFEDRGYVISSYVRTYRRADEVLKLESFKGDLDHERIFVDYMGKMFKNHPHREIAESLGLRMIRKAL